MKLKLNLSGKKSWEPKARFVDSLVTFPVFYSIFSKPFTVRVNRCNPRQNLPRYEKMLRGILFSRDRLEQR
jgi:hypothetical protein